MNKKMNRYADHRYPAEIISYTVWLYFRFTWSFRLSACRHRPFVRASYPRWGEEFRLDRPGRAEPLTMRVMLPPAAVKVRGCLLIIHGMNEYSGRYGDIARHFARRFIVAGFDLYAHGLSNPTLRQADRAIAGGAGEQAVDDAYLAQIPLRDLEPMREDLDRVLRRLISLGNGRADTPVFILSHSLGALVAASYLLDARPVSDLKNRVQGVVFLGPAFSVPQLPGWRGWLANPLIRLSFFAEEHCLKPRGEARPPAMAKRSLALAVALLFKGLFELCSWPGLRRLFTPVTPDWVVDYLTDWEEEKARQRADGYIIRRSLLRYVKGVEREIARFRQRMGEFSTPYFLIYSGLDPITPAWGSHDFARLTLGKHPDNQQLPLPDLCHHEHLFSAPPLRDELLMRIDRWLELRLSSLPRRQDNPP